MHLSHFYRYEYVIARLCQFKNKTKNEIHTENEREVHTRKPYRRQA